MISTTAAFAAFSRSAGNSRGGDRSGSTGRLENNATVFPLADSERPAACEVRECLPPMLKAIPEQPIPRGVLPAALFACEEIEDGYREAFVGENVRETGRIFCIQKAVVEKDPDHVADGPRYCLPAYFVRQDESGLRPPVAHGTPQALQK